MSSKAMSLKGRIKNYAKSNNIAAQVVLQNYMFERFLERLSVSEYNEKFVVKGGMLIAAIVGLDTRSTMDLDTTLRDLPLTEEQISGALSSTRPRDFYDVYILGTTQKYDKRVFKEALEATAMHRGSLERITGVNGIRSIEQISSSEDLKNMWGKYQKKFAYAKDIAYENIIETLFNIIA